MQEEVNQKVISLSIQGVKITASVLKAALRKFLEMDNRRKQKATQVKMAEKTGRAQEKGREKARKKIEKKKPHGKQTIKQLNAQGVQLSNIKITDENIKSFDQFLGLFIKFHPAAGKKGTRTSSAENLES